MPEDKISFVPQSQLEPITYRRGPGILFIACLLVLIVSLAVWGGLFIYKNKISEEENILASSLQRAKEAFQLPTINNLKDLSDQIEVAKNLLNKHISPSAVFDLLERSTVKKITFNLFTFDVNPTEGMLVSLSGVAPDYKTLAQQSSVFEQEEGIIRAEFSNFRLSEEGEVEFSVKILLEPSFVNYKVSDSE
jgi:hypothetical protein